MSNAENGKAAAINNTAIDNTAIDKASIINAADWWKQAVIYQIYPRSFKDTTGSGVGDLRGIIEKIDYIKSLNADALWLNPFYPSALADGGYDVIDYRNVDPRLGTLEDFDLLVEKVHEAGMKIIVDIVPNHTSILHEMFQKALKAAPGSPERDMYIFRDGRGPNGELPPTTWESVFGEPAWERVADGQWYLHIFAKEQPDLNWDNEKVRRDFEKTLRFWADRGADGFRIDVAHGLTKDLNRPFEELEEKKILRFECMPTDGNDPIWDRDATHEIYKEWRKIFNEYDPPLFAVAESSGHSSRLHLYARKDELGQTFNFEFAACNWVRSQFHAAIEHGIQTAEDSQSSTTWVMSNHDTIRHATRYALPQIETAGYHGIADDWLLRDGKTYIEDREKGSKRARAALMIEMALPGSAYIYQGEELGLFEVADIPWDELEDPNARRTSRSSSIKGRDGCRVPLPWTADSRGSYGFSPEFARNETAVNETDDQRKKPCAKPHLRQPGWFADYAADIQDRDSGSMLNFYRKTLDLRRKLNTSDLSLEWTEDDCESDSFDGAEGNKGGVLAFRRANGWTCITNFSAKSAKLPEGKIVLVSSPLADDRLLPQDCCAWIIEEK